MSSSFDCIVIGAGLAGLSAAIELQRNGRTTLVIERRPKVGGLCGTHVFDGHEFVIGCNDFGIGLQKICEDWGVPISFQKVTNRFFFEDELYEIPLHLRSILHLFKHLPDLSRLVSTFKKSRWRAYRTLAELVQARIKHPKMKDFVSMLAYPFGTSPKDLALDALISSFSKELDYGYEKPIIPEGGPGHFAEVLGGFFRSLGGELRLNTACEQIESNGSFQTVRTKEQTYRAKELISSQGRWDLYPKDSKPGLAVSMFHLLVSSTLRYPKGVHTLAYFPKDLEGWMTQIDGGILPDRFGFHVFASHLKEENSATYPMNLYFYLPRGIENPSEAILKKVADYLFSEIERLLPHFNQHLVYKRFVSPMEYEKIHGLSSRAVALILPPGFEKPPRDDPDQKIYYVGNSVQPFGEQAGGAVLSGLMAARDILGKKGG